MTVRAAHADRGDGGRRGATGTIAVVARRLVPVLAAVVVAGIVAVSCGGGAESPRITVYADFSDVGSLIPGAPVDVADVAVGTVSSITLHHGEARVAMSVERSARVPRDVTAQVKVTSILGQNFVELVPGATTAARASAGKPVALLADGSHVARAVVVPGIQQLVAYGAAVFGAVDASQLAQLVATGAQGFGNQSAAIRQIVNGFATTATGYASQTSTVSSLVAEIDRLSASLAPSAAPDAQALSNLAQATGVLASQSGNLNDLLQALEGLAVQSRTILDTFIPDITTDFGTLDAVSRALVDKLSALGGFITWLPQHNAVLQEATSGGYVQVLNDLVFCGVPNGGDQPNAAGTCGGAQ